MTATDAGASNFSPSAMGALLPCCLGVRLQGRRTPDDRATWSGRMRAIGLACLVLLCGAGPANADALADCNQGRNAELRLRACSQIIAGADYSPEQKAVAYRNRGNARADAGASSQALADFNEAIRLQPNEVSGYAGRARARLGVAGSRRSYCRLQPSAAAGAGNRVAACRPGSCALRERRHNGGDCRLY